MGRIKSCLIIVMCLLLTLTAGCTPYNSDNIIKENDGKIKIVTTIFPPYDFAKQICGNLADVTMLLSPGSEAHNYEPSPKDIIKIQNCDIFIYNGGESDEWVEKILASLNGKSITVLKMTDAASLYKEETVEGMEMHGDDDHGDDDHGDDDYDEHVWTSPQNAVKICSEICDTVCEIDPQNTPAYKQNNTDYTQKLLKLDAEFSTAISQSVHKTLIFADRFPARYFTEQYGLNYFAAFPGCADSTEPSSATLAFLIDKVKAEKIKYVFYIEFSNQKIADTVCEATGTKKLLFHSCHNVSADDFKNGITYLELMEQNYTNITEALN